jgi:hypothetical protein
MRSTASVLLIIAWALPPAVTAQTQVEVAPYMGRYRPTTILGSGDGVPADAGDTVKHLSSATWGIPVRKWGPAAWVSRQASAMRQVRSGATSSYTPE